MPGIEKPECSLKPIPVSKPLLLHFASMLDENGRPMAQAPEGLEIFLKQLALINETLRKC